MGKDMKEFWLLFVLDLQISGLSIMMIFAISIIILYNGINVYGIK